MFIIITNALFQFYKIAFVCFEKMWVMFFIAFVNKNYSRQLVS